MSIFPPQGGSGGGGGGGDPTGYSESGGEVTIVDWLEVGANGSTFAGAGDFLSGSSTAWLHYDTSQGLLVHRVTGEVGQWALGIGGLQLAQGGTLAWSTSPTNGLGAVETLVESDDGILRVFSGNQVSAGAFETGNSGLTVDSGDFVAGNSASGYRVQWDSSEGNLVVKNSAGTTVATLISGGAAATKIRPVVVAAIPGGQTFTNALQTDIVISTTPLIEDGESFATLSTTGITVAEAGDYLVECHIELDTTSVAGQRTLLFRVEGVNQANLSVGGTASTNQNEGLSGACYVTTDAADEEITVQLYQASGSNRDSLGRGFIRVTKCGDL